MFVEPYSLKSLNTNKSVTLKQMENTTKLVLPICKQLFRNLVICINSYVRLIKKYISGLELKCPPLLSPSLLKNLPNLRNPLWRALASKPLNRLSSVTPFYKWEAMSIHHILSDLVSDFGKGPKRGFNFFYTYFLNLPNLCSPLWRAIASKPLNRL